jgi:hypothetical protein
MPGGGTRPGEEVSDGPHSDNRCGGNRGGVAPTAAPLRSRAGILRGSGFYTVLGRAFLTPLLALPLALRHRSIAKEHLWCDHDYPGGAGTPCSATPSSVLGAPASLIGSELPPHPR